MQGVDIVYLGINPWDSLMQRPQHLARGLSSRNRVLYVDPTAFSVLTRLAASFRKTGTRRGWLPAWRQLSDSLYLFTPPPLLPFSLWSQEANRGNIRVLSRLLAGAMARVDFRPRVLWISSPQHHLLADLVPADLVCYDCMDNYAAFYSDRRGSLLARQEEALLARAHATFATDRSLTEKCRIRCRGEVHLLPNAVDARFLKTVRRRAGQQGNPACTAELSRLPKPVIGYVGATSHWVDLELMRFLAVQRPKWSFAVVGPGSKPAGRRIPANLHFLGERRHEELPACIDAMDVCLIPFVPSELTQSVNPVKMYEYLARGKPVVATDTQAMRPFAAYCSLASGPSEFLARIETALREHGQERARNARRRIRFASANTWDHRVQEAETVLDRLLDTASRAVALRGRRATKEGRARPAGEPLPEVSVIIVNWNARDQLARCLASVFRHTRGIRFELIVVDNASEDGSAAMVEQEFPQAVLIRNRRNAGFAAACNLGIRAGRGEKILLLNSDTAVCDNAVGEMAAFLDRNPGAAIGGCKLVNENGSYQKSWGRDRNVVNEALEKLLRFGLRKGFPILKRLEEGAGRPSRTVDWVSGAFLMIRRSVVERIGLLDDRFFLYFEDIEWCARAREAGWSVLYHPRVRVIHTGASSASCAAARSSREYRRSQVLYYRIRHGEGLNLRVLRFYLTLRGLADP